EAEWVPIMQRRLARLEVDASGPNCRSYSPRMRLNVSRATPGWTRVVRVVGSMSRTEFMYLLQSSTMPGPIDWPDRLVPPPRAVKRVPTPPAVAPVAPSVRAHPGKARPGGRT